MTTSNLWVIPEQLGPMADSEYAYEACKYASYILWAMSGRKYSGMTTVTESYDAVTAPLNPRSLYASTPYSTAEYLAGSPVPPTRTRIRLRGQPVHSVAKVTDIQGDEIATELYSLVDRRYVEFPATIQGNVDITYSYGGLPPIAGQMAARKLALEFALLWEGSEDCSLPDRVTSVTRAGISYTVLDRQDFIEDLRTGIYEVDLFVKVANPDKARKKAKVFSPDIRTGHRRA